MRALIFASLITALTSLSGCDALVGVEERKSPSKASTSAGGESCGDVASDSHNCGVCNHDCLGGDCLEGKCQPFLVAQTPDFAQQQGLVVDPGADGNIYWGEFRWTGGLFSVAKSSGPVTTLSLVPDNVHYGNVDGTGAATKLAKVDSSLVFHDGYIYAQRATNVIRFPQGLAYPTEELVWFADSPWPLTNDSVSLIWVEHYTGDVFRLAF